MTSRSGGRSSIWAIMFAATSAGVAAASRAASLSAANRLDGSARARAGDIEGGAVIGRGAHERQAERDVDAVVEGERLDRDQRLIVIHAERHVVGRARAPHGTCVSAGQRPARVDALGLQPRDGRRDDRRDPRRRSCRLRRHAD